MKIHDFEFIVKGYQKRGPWWCLDDSAAGTTEYITVNKEGIIVDRKFFIGASCGRNPKDGPANETFYDDGKIRACRFIYKQVYTRDPAEGPAKDAFYTTGQVSCREYLVDGRRHRDPKIGPAVEVFYENGQVCRTTYFSEDRISRDPADGPAVEEFDEFGKSISKEFWLNGEPVR